MKTHELKIQPRFFADIYYGFKHHEFRFNDRGYKLGDRLLLKEFIKMDFDHADEKYTGAELLVEVIYILDCCPITGKHSDLDRWVVMDIKLIGASIGSKDFVYMKG